MEDYDDVMQGKKNPKPLILRAKKGEVIKVTLHNKFTKQVPYFNYPFVPLEKEHIPSNRVSITPQFLKLRYANDSGINVGYNKVEQTIAPGESKTYTWFADAEYGTCMLSSFGDVRNHRYHGLFGAIIIEPDKSTWTANQDQGKADHAEQALITLKDKDSFAENVLFIQNGIRLLDAKNNLIKTVEDEEEVEQGEEVDAEDSGEKGYNYRSERFFNRFLENSAPYLVFSSKVHGDPMTPIFHVHTGQKVMFRTLMPADKPRNVSFLLHGHMWPEHPRDPFTRIIPVQGHISIGNVFDMPLIDGASLPGDYLYRSGSLRWDIESGMWGIMRVSDQPVDCQCTKNKGKFICRCKAFLKKLLHQ